jgi:hypothetical protein
MAKDRTDPVAQTIAAEALTLALARVVLSGMSEDQKQAFAADVAAIAEQICAEVQAQAPAIGQPRGLSPDACNATAARIARDAQAHAKAHVEELIAASAPKGAKH